MEKENSKYKKIVLYIDPEDYMKLQVKTIQRGLKVSAWFRGQVKEFLSSPS